MRTWCVIHLARYAHLTLLGIILCLCIVQSYSELWIGGWPSIAICFSLNWMISRDWVCCLNKVRQPHVDFTCICSCNIAFLHWMSTVWDVWSRYLFFPYHDIWRVCLSMSCNGFWIVTCSLEWMLWIYLRLYYTSISVLNTINPWLVARWHHWRLIELLWHSSYVSLVHNDSLWVVCSI